MERRAPVSVGILVGAAPVGKRAPVRRRGPREEVGLVRRRGPLGVGIPMEADPPPALPAGMHAHTFGLRHLLHEGPRAVLHPARLGVVAAEQASK